MTESTELSLQDHALQELATIEAGLQELETRYGGVVYDVTTTKGMDEAKQARQAIRAPRYAVQNAVAGKKSELAKISKAIGAKGDEIIERISAVEGPIDDQIKAEENRKAEEKRLAEEERERYRQQQLDRLATLQRIPAEHIGAGVDQIDATTEALLADKLADLDDVYRPDGIMARDKAIEDLAVLRTQRVEADAAEAARKAAEEQARAQQAQIEALQRQLAEQQAQADLERRQREEAERAAQAQRDAEVRAERDKAEAIAREERKQDESAAQAERDRLTAEQAERDREHQRQLAKERARSEAAEIASATLRHSASRARDLLEEKGYSQHLVTRMLAAALEREPLAASNS